MVIKVVQKKSNPPTDAGYGFLVDFDTFFVVRNRKVYEVDCDNKWKERKDLDWRKML